MGDEISREGLSGVYGFISHSHHDRDYVHRFCQHLLPAAQELGVDFWVDDSIAAGERWNAEMSKVMAGANVFVLCMSVDYLASEFVYNTEIPTIRKRCVSSGGLIVPVILKRCSWWGFVGDIQAAPTRNGRVLPISDWRPRDNGFHEAALRVIDAILHHFADKGIRTEQPEAEIAGTTRRVIQPSPPGPHRLSPSEIDRAVKTVIARRAAKRDV